MSEVTYKKIVDVEQINALGEGTTLFVNDGGSMKQMGAGVITETITGLEEQVSALTEELKGNGPHQMLVTGADGSTKWEDRTHYTAEETEREFLPEDTYDFSETNGAMMADLPIDALKGGATYVVMFDGVEHVYNAKPYIEGLWYIGNDMCVGGEDSGEPFSIAMEDGVGICVAFNDSAPQHTISITERYSPVVTLPEKYLPMEAIIEAVQNLIKITYVNIPTKTNAGYGSFDMSFDEIIEACRNGLVIGKQAGRTLAATPNYRNSKWYVDFYRYSFDSNETASYLKVISLSSSGEVTETKYTLTA